MEGMTSQVTDLGRTILAGLHPLGVGREAGNVAGAALLMPVTWVGSYVRKLGSEVGHLSRGRWTNANATHIAGWRGIR